MKSKLFLLLTTNFVSLSKSLQEEVYRDFFNLVYGVSMHMIRDHSAAEDIVQEAFMKTIYNAPTFQNEQQLLGWIKVVTKNLSLNLIRKNKRIRNQDDIEGVINSVGNKYDVSVEKEVEVNMLEKNIANSLLEINPDYRRLIDRIFDEKFDDMASNAPDEYSSDYRPSWKKVKKQIRTIEKRGARNRFFRNVSVITASMLLGAMIFDSTPVTKAFNPLYQTLKELPEEIATLFFGNQDKMDSDANTGPPTSNNG